ncbi:MAG: rRNA (guanine1516-N2)-methyltransferase [Pseudomonadota bacterium]|nr:rRNA (guanine1516-N2)-methyltransferase [Pseudomonadota bacterium]
MTPLLLQPAIAVAVESPSRWAEATNLATELGLPLVVDPLSISPTHLLVLTESRLELRQPGVHAPGPIFIDFTTGTAAHRRQFGGGRRQPLARAVGLKSNAMPTVIDATAGLGQDAFVLASLGCQVRLIERSPIMAALLRDGLQRAMHDPEIGHWVRERLSVDHADGCEYLLTLREEQRPDVVYLDPMYPHRRKTALASKEMRLLRQLVGDDDDAPKLLDAALTCARRRVVVKQPRLAPALAGPAPDAHIIAPNTRFDLYLQSLQKNDQLR